MVVVGYAKQRDDVVDDAGACDVDTLDSRIRGLNINRGARVGKPLVLAPRRSAKEQWSDRSTKLPTRSPRVDDCNSDGNGDVNHQNSTNKD